MEEQPFVKIITFLGIFLFSQNLFILDPDSGESEIWETNRWSHVCFAYEKKTGWAKIIKVTLPK